MLLWVKASNAFCKVEAFLTSHRRQKIIQMVYKWYRISTVSVEWIWVNLSRFHQTPNPCGENPIKSITICTSLFSPSRQRAFSVFQPQDWYPWRGRRCLTSAMELVFVELEWKKSMSFWRVFTLQAQDLLRWPKWKSKTVYPNTYIDARISTVNTSGVNILFRCLRPQKATKQLAYRSGLLHLSASGIIRC